VSASDAPKSVDPADPIDPTGAAESAGWGREGKTALANVAAKALSVPIEKAARIVLMVMAAPLLGAVAFGSYQFVQAATTMLALFIDLGTGMWTTRALARDRTRAAAIVGTALRIRFVAVLPYLAIVAVASAVAGPGETRRGLAILGLAALVNAFVDYFGAIFRGFERLGDEARLNVLRAVLIAAAGLGALCLQRSVASLAAGLLVGMILSAIYGLWVLRRRYALGMRTDTFDRTLARSVVSEALPLWVAGLLSLLYFKGDIVILKVFAGDAEIGAYSAAYKVFEGLMILPAVVMAATFPPLARARHQPARQRRWEAVLVTSLLALGLLVGVVVYLGSGRIVRLVYGAGFLRAVPSLRVLSLAVPILFVNYGLTHFMIARDLERRNVAFAGLLLVVNVGVNLVLIPRRGGPGAAWATLITEVVLTTCCLLALRRRTAGSPPERADPEQGGDLG
jgi:O-antigen/teichoic acid export membrane protein